MRPSHTRQPPATLFPQEGEKISILKFKQYDFVEGEDCLIDKIINNIQEQRSHGIFEGGIKHNFFEMIVLTTLIIV